MYKSSLVNATALQHQAIMESFKSSFRLSNLFQKPQTSSFGKPALWLSQLKFFLCQDSSKFPRIVWFFPGI